ncbi:unnamed protein product [Soboliphyme baturini]|uniref:MFS domain-containing protein n=1 Tax=Soboliphyme baturini TaxID=241478 RepID=A0A183IFN8_9BILA|nr:unnamed protein product [Soboliphyme baturini]
MGSKWFINFVQLPIDHTDLDLAQIPYPKTEYFIHFVYRLAEVGTVLGSAVAGPLYNKYGKWKLKRPCSVFGVVGLVTGAVLSPLAEFAWITMNGMSVEDVRRRCYLLRYNKKQLFTDRTVTVFGGMGYWMNSYTGLVQGVNIALAFTIFYNTVLWNYAPHSIRDYREEIPEELVIPKKRF